MDSAYLSAALWSIPLIMLVAGLIVFMVFYRKGRNEKEDYTTRINSFETLYKQGKLSRDEYNQIRFALMRKQGIDIPPEIKNTMAAPKPVRPSMIQEDKKVQEEPKEESSEEDDTPPSPS